jgi:hypothetical protein
MNQKTSNSPIKHKRRYRSPNGINRVYKDGYRYKLKQKIVLSDGMETTLITHMPTGRSLVIRYENLARFQMSRVTGR